jgi:hypothetical protein
MQRDEELNRASRRAHIGKDSVQRRTPNTAGLVKHFKSQKHKPLGRHAELSLANYQ